MEFAGSQFVRLVPNPSFKGAVVKHWNCWDRLVIYEDTFA